MKITGIYQIQSKCKPERIYIGSSVDIHRRWDEHLYKLKLGKHDSPKLQNHYNKYGKNDLIFSILIGCAKEDLVCTEQFYLDSKKHWFNICPVANSSSGVKRSEEFKRKVSINNTKRVLSEEQRKERSIKRTGEGNPFYNHKQTEESNQKRREWNKLHPPTKEAREKQRQSLLKFYEEKRKLKELETISKN